MKKQAAALLILMLAGLTGLVNAQTSRVIKAQVPFDFVAGDRVLTAGETSIKIESDGQTVLWITRGNEHMAALPNASESMPRSEITYLGFREYQGHYFLSSIHRQGESRGYQLPMSTLERELRAQNVTEKDVTLVASLQ